MQGARLLELRAALKLARSWFARGKGDDARELLERASSGMPEASGVPDMVAARSLLL